MPGNRYFFFADFSPGAKVLPGKAQVKEQCRRAPGYMFDYQEDRERFFDIPGSITPALKYH